MTFVKLLHNAPSKELFLPHITEIKQPYAWDLITWERIISSSHMKKAYRDYTIDIIIARQMALEGECLNGPEIRNPERTLHDVSELEGHNSR